MTTKTSIPKNRALTAESVARAERQTRLLRESARAIASGGDPFYPGYDPREIREKIWRTHHSG